MSLINVCGFTCTGQSAIFAFLSGFPSLLRWPGATEGQINRFPGGTGHLWREFETTGRLDDIAVERARRLFSGSFIEDDDRAWQPFLPQTRLWLNASIRDVRSAFPDDYDRVTSIFVAGLSRFKDPLTSGGRTEFLRYIRAFTTKLTDVAKAATGRRHLAWSNLYHPFDLSDRQLYPGIATIVLERDIRDQYVDAVADPAFADSYATPAAFLDHHKRFRDLFAYRGGFPSSEVSALWTDGLTLKRDESGLLIYLSFEHFICREEIRKKLAELLGLDYGSWQADLSPSPFDPRGSVTNVGKFERYPELVTSLNEVTSAAPMYLANRAYFSRSTS